MALGIVDGGLVALGAALGAGTRWCSRHSVRWRSIRRRRVSMAARVELDGRRSRVQGDLECAEKASRSEG